MEKEAQHNQTLQIRDGRILGYAVYGDPLGVPVFYFHGIPACRYEGALLHEQANMFGIKIIAPDRPGYGLSSPQQVGNLLQWPEDVRELADYLEHDRFSIIGLSGGGPYAIASAAVLNERLNRVCVIGGLGPVNQAQYRWKMGFGAAFGFALAAKSERLLRLFYGDLTAAVLRCFPAMAHRVSAAYLPEADQLTFKSKEIRDVLQVSVKEGLGQYAKGAVRDFCVVAKPWGFNLEDISIPVHLWHGEADTIVPIEHCYYFAENIPKVETHYVPDEGHFSLPIQFQTQILAGIKSVS